MMFNREEYTSTLSGQAQYSRPIEWYRWASQQQGFTQDPAQKNAVAVLDNLWEELVRNQQAKGLLLSKVFLRKRLDPPRGVYLWGGVGRGKSLLLDVFYFSLPFPQKMRVHFHAFMAQVHQRMSELKESKDSLIAVAEEIAQQVRVLCLDEFHVSDIADAMILGRLLKNLLEKRIVIVTTSNYQPSELYYQGQNRISFLPTIDLLYQYLEVLQVDNQVDYRFRNLDNARVFLHPLTPENENSLLFLFNKLIQNESIQEGNIEILGRQIAVKARTESCIWFDFENLCGSLRSQQDYLQIAEQYSHIFISGVKRLDSEQKDVARRLTWLIDIFYDHHVKLALTSEVKIEDIYTEGDFAEEFLRTVSRMIEMQSQEYLKLPHLRVKS
ncbi:MAG: cell division protein ZapE [Neisseriaceae bacterium]